MDRQHALAVMHDNVRNGSVCGGVVKLLEEHYDEIDAAREKESREVGQRYYQSLSIKSSS